MIQMKKRGRAWRVLKWFLGLVGLVTLLFLSLIGPWPNYEGGLEKSDYLKISLARLVEKSDRNSTGEERDQLGLMAGWARVSIAPPIGGPLAGFGARKGKASVGIRDEVFVKALALSDGVDTAVLLGSDLLIVPENIADAVRERIATETPLSGDEILFNASHNHSGPGAFAPGLVSGLFNGPFDENVPRVLTQQFVAAIKGALDGMAPAKYKTGGTEVPDYIRNREREGAPVDAELSYLWVEKETGEQCVVVSYSAHPTVIGSENLEITGEYPGYLMTHLERRTGAEAIYLGGAVGSMGHRAPDGESDFERSKAMGEALAERVVTALQEQEGWESDFDVVVIGVPIELPPYQARLNQNFRFSGYLLPLLGVDHDAWLQGVRLGQTVWVGTPADFCGEISVTLKGQAADSGVDLWVLSFNGDYVGYISPDRYYNDLESDGTLGYERGTMSWLGPQQEAYMKRLIDQLVDGLYSGDR